MANQPVDVPVGETALGGDPSQMHWGQGDWQGPAGGDKGQQFAAWQDFYKEFERNPTQQELDMLAGSYAGDPNIPNLAQGKQAVAQYYNSITQTPANIYKRQQDQWQQQANNPQIQGSINQLFQSTYGRAPTADEANHYGTLLASGQADAYTLGQFLQSLPEYQSGQDKQFRQGLDTEMQQSDTNFFNTTKGNIAQQYALMGRPTSPALDVALTDFATQLSNNRQNYLSQLSAQQYGSNKQAAMGQYGQSQNDVMGRINQNSQTQYGNFQGLQNRLNDITDYNTQSNAYNQAMQRYGSKGAGPLDYLNTALNGANAGANVWRAGAGH